MTTTLFGFFFFFFGFILLLNCDLNADKQVQEMNELLLEHIALHINQILRAMGNHPAVTMWSMMGLSGSKTTLGI